MRTQAVNHWRPGKSCRRGQVAFVSPEAIPDTARVLVAEMFPGWAVVTWKHCTHCDAWWAEMKDLSPAPRGVVDRRLVVVGMGEAGWAPASFKPLVYRI